MRWRVVVLWIVVMSWGGNLLAQYYSWGADHPRHKWQSVESAAGFEVIYPDSTDAIARRILFYLNSLEESYGVGFTYSDERFPVVVHPENSVSNGMAMWMPSRVEFLSTPSEDNYSTLWLKQLAAHEYRHVIQYNNLNQGFIKWLSYFLGEQGSAAGYAFMPLYAIEGDAVMFETQTTTFGRALQPSFSMAYRAIGRDILQGERLYQKWFAGSYREYIPNHYYLGYQLTSYGYTTYGIDMWDKVFGYAVRHPYVFATTRRALKKYHSTTIPQLFTHTFEELNDYWDALPVAGDYAEIISEQKSRNYTQYSNPLYTESGDIIALMQDYDTPSHFVIFDEESGEQSRVRYTGLLSSRPDYAAGKLWWSEYRRSLLFSQKWGSSICYLDLESGKKGRVKGAECALYPTPIGDDKEHYGYVDYHYAGQYSVVEMRDGKEIARFAAPFFSELHALAWDNQTCALYTIVLGEEGMYLGRCKDGAIQELSEPAYITLSDLRAADGVLYFGSIASGRDEIHSFSIESGEQRVLTSSSYGAFDPSRPNERGEIAMTTYNKLGYHLSTQSADALGREVETGKIPLNIVNPPRVELGVINLDTVSFTPADSLALSQQSPPKKFRKGRNLFNIHSWAPIKYNPFTLSTDDMGIGVTLLSQSLLSTADGYASYGWSRDEGSTVEAGATLYGLGLQFDVAAMWGGEQRIYNYYTVMDSEGSVLAPDIPVAKHRYSISGAVTLPLYFSGGYMSSSLYLSSAISLKNDRVQSLSGYEDYLTLYKSTSSQQSSLTPSEQNQLLESITEAGYSSLLTSWSFTVSHSRFARLAYRDTYPRLGYSLSGSYIIEPFNRDFSSLCVAAAVGYLPGVAKNHSLRLSAGYQTQIGGYEYASASTLGFQSLSLIPVGYTTSDFFSDNLIAAGVDYSLPICYPNIGIPSVLFIKRLRANLGAGYARYNTPNNYTSTYGTLFSYGVDLSVDFTLLRLPDASTMSVTFSLYKPYKEPLYFAFGFNLPI